MNNGKDEVCLEIRSPGGELLFTIAVKGIELLAPTTSRAASTPTNGNGTPSESHRANSRGTAKSQSNGEPMTDAQKRYLFRILADQGKEGDEATNYLKETFQVRTLKEITKQEASKAIERLLEHSKGGKSNGSPVKQSN